MAGEITLATAITAVLTAWQALVGRGEMSEQTLSRFGQLLGRFEAFAAVRGAKLLTDVDAAIAAQFIDAHGRTRHGHIAPASLSTRHLRRSVLRMCFTTARRLALTDTDPTRDIDLPPRLCGATRPLDEAEAVELRRAAQFTDRPTRHAAAAALALAGGFSGEIGHIHPRDLDLACARVWMHGSAKTRPRWCPLDTWGAQVLAARAHHIHATRPPEEDPHRLRLAVSSRNGTDEQIQARVCVALRDLLKRIGLSADAAVRPASITAYAGWETFHATAVSRPQPATWAWPPSTAPQPSSATSGIPRRHTAQFWMGATAMPDDLFGDRLPPKARKKTARRASEADLRTVSQRITDVARFEDLYRIASVLAPDPGPRRGRPPHYPPYIYLLFLALRGIHGSARYCAGDLQDPSVWTTIRNSVAHHLGTDEAARLPETGPSRHQWQHAQRTLLIPHLEELGETFADLALAQALRQGLLSADARRSWSSPQRHQLIAGDGTVTKSPTLSTTPYSVDATTGESAAIASTLPPPGRKKAAPTAPATTRRPQHRPEQQQTPTPTPTRTPKTSPAARPPSPSTSPAPSWTPPTAAWASSTTAPCAACTATSSPAAAAY
ncbi:hypothetical protein GCM10010246_09550 [Streptomyces cuspidosporus]|uniref:Core-binding (CB) domain-containing protein n=1 Tax=Streptomyces cuspidosporus TaxID=66882 RepID=A0ABN3FFK3_9ACTN